MPRDLAKFTIYGRNEHGEQRHVSWEEGKGFTGPPDVLAEIETAITEGRQVSAMSRPVQTAGNRNREAAFDTAFAALEETRFTPRAWDGQTPVPPEFSL